MGYHREESGSSGAVLMKQYHIQKLQDCYTCHR